MEGRSYNVLAVLSFRAWELQAGGEDYGRHCRRAAGAGAVGRSGDRLSGGQAGVPAQREQDVQVRSPAPALHAHFSSLW